jgi:predicted DNA-binding protein (UPF0251 family)
MLSKNELEQIRLEVVTELTKNFDSDQKEPGQRFITQIVELASKTCSQMLIKYQNLVASKKGE